jgi:hypothetical protein
MEFLYRTYSDNSHGTNNRLGFKPASATAGAAPGADLKNELNLAIRGASAPHNPFIFATPSLLLALVFAHHRQANNEKNIHIACIDVNASRTPSGTPVTFRSVASLANVLGLPLKINRDGTPRFGAEYVTMDRIVMKGDSRTASFDTILDNLYNLYPSIKEAFMMRRRNSGMNLELRFLRELYFETDFRRSLDPGRLSLAARITSAFTAKEAGHCKAAPHILAAVLSLQSREIEDEKMLSDWLQADCIPKLVPALEGDRYTRPSQQFCPPATAPVVIDLTQDDDNDDETPQVISALGEPDLIDLTAEEPTTSQLPITRAITSRRQPSPFHIAGAPEMDVFHAMWTILRSRRIPDTVLNLPIDNSQQMVHAEIEQWNLFKDEKNAEHWSRPGRLPRKNHGARQGRQDLAPRTTRQPREDGLRQPRAFAARRPRTEAYSSRRDRRY